jgi:hypothetical protein
MTRTLLASSTVVVGLLMSTSFATAQSPPANGSYIINPDGVVCIVLDGKKRWICAEIWGPVLGKPDNLLIRLDKADFSNIPTGIPYLPDGIIVRNKAGTQCAVWGGQKRYISGPLRPAFDRPPEKGGRRPDYLIPAEVFDNVPTGPEADAELARRFPVLEVGHIPPPPPSGGRDK